jgi:hypothetical protein
MCRTARNRPRPTTLVFVTVPLPAKYANAIEPKIFIIFRSPAWLKDLALPAPGTQQGLVNETLPNDRAVFSWRRYFRTIDHKPRATCPREDGLRAVG